jgi:uncharacterized hydrophobic protein (TIGR00271 family)
VWLVLVHFRLTVPPALSGQVQQGLRDREWTTNVTVLVGAGVEPAGDLIECDVAREKAGVLLNWLDEVGLDEEGGIVVLQPLSTPFAAADRIERLAPGHPDDAVIWEAVEAHARAGATPTLSFHAFLLLAVVIAAVAVVTDSPILVVGAMVVGPEFSAIAAASAGAVLGRWDIVGASLRLLVLAFLFAVVVTTVLALLGRGLGMVDTGMLTQPRPDTGFIWRPDQWSAVVALVAGAAGVLALAIERTATMVGVFISVTTVPAAGNLALGLAFTSGSEILGSLAQLGINVACMLVSGVVVLALMRSGWSRLSAVSERLPGWSNLR